MKAKLLVSFFGLCASWPAMGLHTQTGVGGPGNPETWYIVSSPSDLGLIPVNPGQPFRIVINGGGAYNLSELDGVSHNALSVQFNEDYSVYGTGNHDEIVLIADADFDGVFDTDVIVENVLYVRLSDNVLNRIPVGESGEIIRFAHIPVKTEMIFVDQGGNYNYVMELCSGDNNERYCLKRRYSDEYISELRREQYEAQVVAIGATHNPKVLLHPMTTINRHELLAAFDFSDEFFISGSPEYYNAQDFQSVGMRLNSGTKFGGKLYVGASVYANKIDFQNAVSEFESDMYGGNLRFRYDIDDVLFLRGVGGISFSNIKCDNVIKGNSTVNNPDAIGIYGGVDFGAIFNFESGLYISPFVGLGALSGTVVGVRESDVFGHFGSDVGFKYFMDGVRYNYMLRAGIDSNGFFDTSMGIGVTSVSDKIGANVSFGILDTDFGLSGKVAADIRFAF